MQKENLPRIPRSNVPEDHDAASILAEIFQEVLEKPSYPQNIAKNIAKYRVQCEGLKAGAQHLRKTVEDGLIRMEDVRKVEEKIVAGHAEYLDREEKISQIPCEQEKRLLSRKLLFPSLEEQDSKKYGLLRQADLLPNFLETAIDFKLNPELHTCDPCSDLDLIPVKLTKSPKGKRKRVPTPTAVKCTARLDKDIVLFYNYELNTTYKKKFKVQNISNVGGTCAIHELPTTRYFHVIEDKRYEGKKISPGMSMVYYVSFRTDTRLDMIDYCTVKVNREEFLTVKLVSYRQAPSLWVYVLKQTWASRGGTKFDPERSMALNNTIDCGACFVGATIDVDLIVKNNGGLGRFFFMTDEDWTDYYVVNMNIGLELQSNMFSIYPAYFQVDTDEYMLLNVVFLGKYKGLNLLSLRLLCDNITFECIDMIADAILYDQYCVVLSGEELIDIKYLGEIICPPQTLPDYSGRSGYFFDMGQASENDGEESVFNDTTPYSQYLEDAAICYEQNEIPLLDTEDAIMQYLGRNYDEDGRRSDDSDVEEFARTELHGKHLIYYGNCVPNNRYTRNVTVRNCCPVNLPFYWTIDDISSEKYGFDHLKNMSSDALEIEGRDATYLTAYTECDFNFTVNIPDGEECFYMIDVSLYVSGIPKCAIRHPDKFVLKQREENENGPLYDVLIAEILLLCKLTPLVIEFQPPEIDIEEKLRKGETYKTTFNVQIHGEQNEPFKCSWYVEKPEVLTIEPQYFEALVGEIVKCVLTVLAIDYCDIERYLALIVDDSNIKPLLVKANVKNPEIVFEESRLDFGVLPLGNIYSKKVKLINDSDEVLEYYILENMVSKSTNIHSEIVIRHLDDETIELEYIVCAFEKNKWHSILNVYCYEQGLEYLSSTCSVSVKISDWKAHLHTESSVCPIVCPTELLFVNHRKHYLLCIHNCSELNLDFCFGDAFGTKEDAVDVTVVPKYGEIEAFTSIRLDLYLTPLAVGIVDEVYIPCYYDCYHPSLLTKLADPKIEILTIMCAAEDIFVHVKIPANHPRNEDIEFDWPPQIVYDFDYIDQYYKTEDAVEMEEDRAMPQRHVQNDRQISPETDMINMHEYLEDLAKYLDSIVSAGEEPDEPEFFLKVPMNTPISSTSTSTICSMSNCDSLRQYFEGDDLAIQEYVVEFYKVPLRRAVKKTILLENSTPVVGSVFCESTNFSPLDVEEKKIDRILVEMKLKKDNHWENIVPAEGIVVKAHVTEACLCPFGKTSVEIWVYANTWGVYADEVIIEINEVMPLSITVLVEVVGLPLEFPFACKQNAVFRFGSIPYKSNELSKKIYVKNNSFIPVSIVWHIFMKTEDVDENAIKIIFDIFHPNVEGKLSKHDSLGNLIIPHKRFTGDSETNIFFLDPKETFVKPGDTTWITVTFNPRLYAVSFKKTQIQSYLVGYIALPGINRHRPNYFKRPTGSEMCPLILRMLADLELPRLDLELVRGDLRTVICATSVFEKSPVETEKVLIFKNRSNVEAVVKFETKIPFQVVSVKTMDCTSNGDEYILVDAGQCVEVTVRCTLEENVLERAAESYCSEVQKLVSVYGSAYTGESEVIKLSKKMAIRQEGFRRQSIYLELSIYFPMLEVTECLNFGTVFVGNCKKLLLTIRNLTPCEVPFNVSTSSETQEVVAHPTKGILSAAKANVPQFVDVGIIFIPREYKSYEETVIVTTIVPYQKLKTLVVGDGSHDEVHYTPDKC